MDKLNMRFGFWMLMALLNFLLAAIMGAVLRFAFVAELPWVKYKFLMHGHSHVAMLGWLYLGLITLLVHIFLDEEQQQKKIYKHLFLLTQVSVIGMLVSFPIQGYAGFSIAFSTLHVLVSYWFVWRFRTDLKQSANITFSALLALTALGFMILSTMGLWAMPLILLSDMRGSMLYYMAVQFFLHFQFNGWFIFAVLALFFRFLEKQQLAVSTEDTRVFYRLLLVSAFLTFALAVAWSNPQQITFWVNSLGVTVQLLAVLWLLKIVFPQKDVIRRAFDSWNYGWLKLAFLAFVLKVFIQTAVVVPYIATIAYTIRNYVIGFIHLLLLGIISICIFAFAGKQNLIVFSGKLARAGIYLFLAGFLLSEALLFLQGTLFWGAMGFLPAYYPLLFGASALIPFGLILLLWAQRYVTEKS